MRGLTERSILNSLWRRFQSASRIIAPTYQPPYWYECDLFRLLKSGRFEEYEVKLTLSDFRADESKGSGQKRSYKMRRIAGDQTKHQRLANPDGWTPNRFTYVVPEGMIGPNDVPHWAGLWYAHTRPRWKWVRFTIVRNSPLLHDRLVPDPDRVEQQLLNRLYYRFWQARVRQG